MKPRHVEFLVLGAGLQGSAIALELARRGKSVTLVDQDPLPMNRASLRNEGKIHLGLIYAADPSMNTALMQLRGALQFRRLLGQWLGPRMDDIGISTPFTYLVAEDSLFSPDALDEHYDKLGAACREHLQADKGLDYLGFRPDRLTARAPASHIRQYFNASRVPHAFLTEERAINPDDLARTFRSALGESGRISFMPNCQVREIERFGGKTRISAWLNGAGQSCQIDAEHVVNATWEERLRLDRMAGLPAPAGWVHRLKFRAIMRPPEALLRHPSATMVLGRYGDVVIRPNDGSAFLSWYPTGLRGWSHELSPPQDWTPACQGRLDSAAAAEIGAEITRHISAWYPGVEEGRLLQVDAGAIFAYGCTDVDDKDSGLHDRTRIGVSGDSGYLSVDPGKLTTAPLFAVEAVRRLLDEQDGAHDGE